MAAHSKGQFLSFAAAALDASHQPIKNTTTTSGGLFSCSPARFFARINWSMMGRKPQSSCPKWKRHWVAANRSGYEKKALADHPLKSEHFLEANKAPSIPPILKEPAQPAYYDLVRVMSIQEGDLVQVLYGRDMGKQGVVRKIHRRKNSITVHGLNMKKSFRVDTGDRRVGSTLCSVEMPLHVTNVMLVDPVTKKPTRVKRR